MSARDPPAAAPASDPAAPAFRTNTRAVLSYILVVLLATSFFVATVYVTSLGHGQHQSGQSPSLATSSVNTSVEGSLTYANSQILVNEAIDSSEYSGSNATHWGLFPDAGKAQVGSLLADIQSQMAGSGQIVDIYPTDEGVTYGAYVEQHEAQSVTGQDGSSDWTVATDVSDVRNSELTMSAGQLGDASNKLKLFAGSSWQMNFWTEPDTMTIKVSMPNHGGVVYEVADTENGNSYISVDPVQGTVNGEDVGPGMQTVSGSYDVRFENGAQAEATYRFVLAGDLAQPEEWSNLRKYRGDIMYSADFAVTYENANTVVTDEITVTPAVHEPVSTDPKVIEDFETGDLWERYDFVDGDRTKMNRTTDGVMEGQYSLHGAADRENRYWVWSEPNHPHFDEGMPSRGDTIHWWYRSPNDSEYEDTGVWESDSFYYASNYNDSEPDSYEWKDGGDDSIRKYIVNVKHDAIEWGVHTPVGGTNYWEWQTGVITEDQTWYHFSLEWGSPEHTLRVYSRSGELLWSETHADTNLSRGGIGFHSSMPTTRFDNVYYTENTAS